MRALFAAIAMVAGLGVSAPALAHGYTLGPLTIDHPWALPTDDLSAPGLAFFSVRNSGDTDARLTGVIPLGGIAEAGGLFTVSVGSEGDVETLEAGIIIPAGETVRLQANGPHIRLIGLNEPLTEGEAELVKLVFEDLGEINVLLAVYNNTEGGHHHH